MFVPCRKFQSCVHETVWDFVSYCGVKVGVFVTYSWVQLRVFLNHYRSKIWVLELSGPIVGVRK